MTSETQTAIADQFRRNLAAELSAMTLLEIDRRNRSPEYAAACASHDFCDANVPMSAAFETVTGRPFLGEEGPTDSDLALWGAAWNEARAAGFSAPPVMLSVDDGTLDSFVLAYCEANGIECEGGAFGIMFSGAERFTIAESVELIERGADVYQLRD